MYDEDVALARKRGRHFTCSMIGACVLFLLCTAMLVFVTGQFSAVTSLILEAAPGETVASGIPYLYFNPVSYVAQIEGHSAPVERVGPYQEYVSSLEFSCRNNTLFTQSPNEQISDMTYPVKFQFVNDCDRIVNIKVCWWNEHSLMGPFFLPSCTF